MSTVTATRRLVEIPTDADGFYRPELLPVAAFLCIEEYTEQSRERILARLMDGQTARDCYDCGALDCIYDDSSGGAGWP